MISFPVIPDWMKVINDNAAIGCREIMQIYNISLSTLNRHLEDGTLPTSCVINSFKRKHRLWKMKDVREHINSLKKKE